MCLTLFIDALNGKYNNENRWISREDFFRLKDTDPYVAVVWSFGNNLRDYLYSKEIEPLKKAIHYALFFSDYSLGKELGLNLSFIDPIQDLQKRYLAVKHYFNKLGHFQQQSFEGWGRIRRCSQSKHWNDSTPICRIGGGRKDLSRLETMERLTSVRQSCNTWNVSIGCRKSKKSQDKSRTSSGQSELHRLQCRERQHSLPRYSGGSFYLSRPLCLTMKMSRYPKTA